MATKLDTDKKIFLGPKVERENTTFGVIRKAVSELDKGEGVSYADLEAHLLANYVPPKSKGYGAGFIKSYVRDGVNKFGQLSHEDTGITYEATAVATKSAEAAAKPKKLTKADQARNDLLRVVRDKGEVTDASLVDASKVTVETLMQETKKKTKTIEGMVAELEKSALVRTEKVENSVYVFLTVAGLAAANVETMAPVASPEQPEGTAATTEAAEEEEGAA